MPGLLRSPKLGIVALLAGCGATARSAEPVSATDLTSAQYSAAYRIADARCACSDGPAPDCIARLLLPSAASGQLAQCSARLDEAQLERCLSEIRQSPCGTGLVALDACHEPALCRGRAQEGTQ